MKYWLLKTEPGTFSFSELKKVRKTNWDQVRNYQARNFLRQIEVGDLALIYHSGDQKAVVGTAKVIRAAYPDIDPEEAKIGKSGDWVQVDVAFEAEFDRPIPLSEIKKTATLNDLLLIKQSRLSVMPVSVKHYDAFMRILKK